MWVNIKALGYPYSKSNPPGDTNLLTVLLITENSQFVLPVILNPKGVEQDILICYEDKPSIIEVISTPWNGYTTRSGVVSSPDCHTLFQFQCLENDYTSICEAIVNKNFASPFKFTALQVFS